MAKVLVSIGDRLLERLDAEAKARGISRSALIAELAAKGLGEPIGPGARPEVHAAMARLDELFRTAERNEGFLEDSTITIRRMRDERNM
ncbi:MAG TPA: ribbon-helix-helix protein, CopG family [Chloroflexota bacterium]|jgi:hypothetical protein|nr:ribbon-helix-helix protein, CopG family [Chloroflexota bacterium]